MILNFTRCRQAYSEAKNLYKAGHKKDAAVTLAKGIKGLFWGKSSKPRNVTVRSFEATSTTKAHTLTGVLSAGKGKNPPHATFSAEKTVHDRAVKELQQNAYFSDVSSEATPSTTDKPTPVSAKHARIHKNATRSDDGREPITESTEPTNFGEKIKEHQHDSTNAQETVTALQTEGNKIFRQELKSSDIHDLLKVNDILTRKGLFIGSAKHIWNQVFTTKLADAVAESIVEESLIQSESQQGFKQLLHEQQNKQITKEQILPQLTKIVFSVFSSDPASETYEQEDDTLLEFADSTLNSLNSTGLQQRIHGALGEQIEDHDVTWEFETSEVKRKQPTDRKQKAAQANRDLGIETRKKRRT